jgi:hypothetical protein
LILHKSQQPGIDFPVKWIVNKAFFSFRISWFNRHGAKEAKEIHSPAQRCRYRSPVSSARGCAQKNLHGTAGPKTIFSFDRTR